MNYATMFGKESLGLFGLFIFEEYIQRITNFRMRLILLSKYCMNGIFYSFQHRALTNW
jgi:hypothetical protein